MDDLLGCDRLAVRQRDTLTIKRYDVLAGDGEPRCFVEQRRFKLKEDVRFYADDSKAVELLRVIARQALDSNARYDVTLPDGTTVGGFQKEFRASIMRSTFTLFDAAGDVVCRARERSRGVALIRRALGVTPLVRDIADFLPMPYDFEFLAGDRLLGTNRRRRWSWRDVYDLDLTGDPERILDRRVALAATIAMDTIQDR